MPQTTKTSVKKWPFIREYLLVRAFAEEDEVGIEAEICRFFYENGGSICQHDLSIIAGAPTAAFLVSTMHADDCVVIKKGSRDLEDKGIHLRVSRPTIPVPPPRLPNIPSRGVELWMRAPDVAGLLWQTCKLMKDCGYSIWGHSGYQCLRYRNSDPFDENQLDYIQSLTIVPTPTSNPKLLQRRLEQMVASHRLLYRPEELVNQLRQDREVKFVKDHLANPLADWRNI